MSNSPADDERLDSDPTDELPILLETAVLDPEEHRVAFAGGDDVTGEHTILSVQDMAEVEALRSDLEQRAAKIVALEQDISRLSARWSDVERHLTAKDTLVDELNTTLASLRAAHDSHMAAERRLTAEIANRDAQIERVNEQLEQRKRDLAARGRELAEHKHEKKRALDELVRLKGELAAASREPVEVQSLREEVATLTSYIANRRTSWDELDAKSTAQAERIAELEREVAHRAERQQRGDVVAERYELLREQLVEQSRRTETFDAELKKLLAELQEVRSAGATLEAQLAETRSVLAEAQVQLGNARQSLADQLVAQAASEERHAAALAAANERHAAELAAAAAAAARAAASAAAVPQASLEAIAQLEADLEHKRSELTAERAAARRQAERLAAELESAQQQLAATQTLLDEARGNAARLEHAVIDKDRALQARDEQVATLQKALDQKLGALQKLNAMDLSLQGLDSKMSERLRRTEAPHVEPGNTPALLCLTSDVPREYALTKPTMTIGRSSRCDIQILTQFVSREHVRITTAPGAVVVEDLGSTNGIFVNAVRIDRQELRHGDLLTVGETQFRFLESMAH
jgi:chromosome segregation ATPase